MMKNVQVKHYDEGLIIKQEGVRGMICIPNVLKPHFYENLLTACINGNAFSWYDLEGDEMTFHYEYKNKFNCFINGCCCGDLPFILLSDTSVAIPIETEDDEQLYEVYDSSIMENYLLYQSELF